jgi:hypothetical protein
MTSTFRVASKRRLFVDQRLFATIAALLATLSLGCSADAGSLAGTLSGNGTKTASGRVSLSVSIAASGSQTGSGTTQIKNELAQADLAFILGEVQGIGGQIFKWDNAQYGGTASWFEEHITPGSVQIPGTLNARNCTHADSTTQSFSSAGAGGQPGNIKLELQGDQYQLFIDAAGSGPTNETDVFHTDCTSDGQVARSTKSSTLNLVPLSGYFSSDDASAGTARVAITRPLAKGATRVNDVLQWTSKWVVFSSGTTVVTVPVVARLTWDFTIK